MEHHFNIEIAKEFGVDEAIILHNFFFWISKNAANGRNLNDGLYWLYNSKRAFVELFPYMNESKIFRVLKRLNDAEIITKGNYSEDKWNKTNWYALTRKGLAYLFSKGYKSDSLEQLLLQNDDIDCGKMNNGTLQSEQCNNTDINTDIKRENEIDKSISKRTTVRYADAEFEKAWIAYKRKGSKKVAYERWQKLSKEDKEKVMKHIPHYLQSNEFIYLKDFCGYLNQRVFESVVYDKQGRVLFDPDREGSNTYAPTTGWALDWSDKYNCYLYIGEFYGELFDGYKDEARPDGATIMLNNGRGTIKWNKETKKWEKQ